MTRLRGKEPPDYRNPKFKRFVDDPGGRRAPSGLRIHGMTIAVPYIEPYDDDPYGLSFGEFMAPDKQWKGKDGRFVSRDQFGERQNEEAAYERWVMLAHDNLWNRPNTRGNPELGTYRSKRKARDAQRNRDRVTSCVVCGGPAPEKARSDWRAHPKCRVAKLRASRRAVVEAQSGDRRNGSAANMVVSMDPKRLSPMTEALIDAVLAVWAVPMPNGYPDEAEWRLGQAMAIHRLAVDERHATSPSVARFNKRARIYVKHMERTTKRINKETRP